MRNILFIFSAAGMLFFQCCRKGNSSSADISETAPVSTEKGIAAGDIRSYPVDAAGATIVSANGDITLEIPQGAVSTPTTVGIQPISNNAPLGLGTAYRLTPEGTHFEKPVTLRFNYSNMSLNGAIPDFFWVTTQNEDGTWSADTNSEVDTVAKTVTVTTTHFSDWALGRFIDFTLNPSSATLKVNESITLSISGFLKPTGPDNEVLHPLAPIGSELVAIDQVMALLDKTKKYKEFKISGWALNGTKAPVTNSFGSLQPNDKVAVFKAPASRPDPNVVAVSASLDAWQANGTKSGYLLVSNIAIIDTDYYLSLTVDGQDYYYTQYIAPAIPPDFDNLHAVNGGIAALSNALEIRASYLKTSTGVVQNSFHINFTDPAPGRRSFKCKYDITGEEDEIEFTPSGGGTPYLMTYVRRYYNDNNVCMPEYKCSDLSFTLLEFNGPNKPARGSFSGYIYEDPDAYSSSCKSSEKHFIKGAFNLFVNPN